MTIAIEKNYETQGGGGEAPNGVKSSNFVHFIWKARAVTEEKIAATCTIPLNCPKMLVTNVVNWLISVATVTSYLKRSKASWMLNKALKSQVLQKLMPVRSGNRPKLKRQRPFWMNLLHQGDPLMPLAQKARKWSRKPELKRQRQRGARLQMACPKSKQMACPKSKQSACPKSKQSFSCTTNSLSYALDGILIIITLIIITVQDMRVAVERGSVESRLDLMYLWVLVSTAMYSLSWHKVGNTALHCLVLDV